jgi:predicted small secreted protein
MKFREAVSAVLVMSAMYFALTACQKQEGPAERAGKETDKAVESVGKQIEKAGESIQDAAKGNKKP